MSKLGNMGLSEASDIFSKMSNDKFIAVLDFIEYELKFNISLSFGSKRLLWNDVKYALYFVEYLKNTKKERVKKVEDSEVDKKLAPKKRVSKKTK